MHSSYVTGIAIASSSFDVDDVDADDSLEFIFESVTGGLRADSSIKNPPPLSTNLVP